MACRVRVPHHDAVEIDCLRRRAPVTVDAEARLGVDERYAVAPCPIDGVAHRPAIRAAMLAIKPDIRAAAGILSREKPDMHRRPTLAKRCVDDADQRAPHDRRGRARLACRHLREEAHVLAERPRFDLEERARLARSTARKGILLDLVDHGATRRAPGGRDIARPVGADLEGEAVPNPLAELDEFAVAVHAIGLDLHLGALGRGNPAWPCLHLGSPRAGIVADIVLRRMRRCAGTVKRIALLDGDATNCPADRVRDDADAQGTQLGSELRAR